MEWRITLAGKPVKVFKRSGLWYWICRRCGASDASVLDYVARRGAFRHVEMWW